MTYKLHAAKHYLLHWLKAKRAGHGVHSPFAYELCEEVFYNKQAYYVFDKLNFIRDQLLLNQNQLRIEDYGAGSNTFKDNVRSIAEIAKRGTSTKQQSELLFRLIHHLQLKTCIEFGSSLGLNTLYLAAAAENGKAISIEGSTALHAFAKQLAEKNNITNVEFVCGKFDEVLPTLLSNTNEIDFAYVDGNHREDATLRYFEFLLPYCHNTSVLVFDDIYWSPGMTRAWRKITQHPKVRMSIDLYSTGLVFFKEEIKQKQHLRMLL